LLQFRLSDNPLVTVVTPSFNQGRYISETIESVLGQNYTNLEYMVIDGSSTDDTVDILKSHGDRFYWVSEKDNGQPDAINKGWRRARGEVLAWLNSDDVYLPGAVSRAVEYLREHPDVAAVYGEGHHIKEDGSIIERYPTEPFDRERLRETCYICQPTVFIRREVLADVGFLDDALQLCMDYDLWLRIAKKYDFGYLPEHLACTRFYPEAKTLNQRVEVHREILSVVRRHSGFVPPLWIYAYGHAYLERFFDRSKKQGNLLFIASLIGLSIPKFLRYNHIVPASEFRRWWGWLKNGMRKRVRKTG
jgi:glycosyltransferase involved in cell wall biosynthesis